MIILLVFFTMLTFVGCDIFEFIIFDEPPVAVITTEDLYVKPKTRVSLNGVQSNVPWGSPSLEYVWEILSVPDGSAIDQQSLENATSPTISFTPDIVGHYALKLTALYKNRSGEAQITIFVMDPPTAPASPRVTAQSATVIQVEWDEVAQATGYILQRNGSPVYRGNDLAYIDTNLSPHTMYSYVLSAENQVGVSGDSPTASTTTDQVPPSVPTGYEIIERTTSSLTLKWDEADDATHYVVYRSTDNETFTSTVYEGQTAQFTDTGLSAATTYYYRIRASNGAGYSNMTASLSGRTRFQPLGTPQNLQVDSATTSSVRYTWSPVDGATEYRVESGNTTFGPWADPQSVSAATHQRDGLQAGQAMFVRVTAVDSLNPDRDSSPAILRVQTIPAAPTNLQLAVGSSSSKAILLSWDAMNGADYYQVFQATTPHGSWGWPIAEPRTAGYEDGGLSANKTYYYHVKAVNEGGTSAASDTKSFTLSETDQYTVHINVSPSDGGYVTGDGTFTIGASTTLKAFPNSNYLFSHWDTDTNDTSTQKQITCNSTTTVTHTANFSKKKINVNVTVNPKSSGTVSGGGEYAVGDWVELKATAKPGYLFSHWNGDTNDRNIIKSFTASSNVSHVANFTTKRGTVVLAASPSNGGTVIGGGTFDEGELITIEAKPATGYQFDKWSDGNKNATRNIWVSEGTNTYTAEFSEKKPIYTITVSNKTHPSQNITNSDDITIHIQREGGLNPSNITLELRSTSGYVATIGSYRMTGNGSISYSIPSSANAGATDAKNHYIELNDTTYVVNVKEYFLIYNVLDGNNKSKYIGVVPKNTSTAGNEHLENIFDWIDRYQPSENLIFTTPDNPRPLATTIQLYVNIWYNNSYGNYNFPGTKFKAEILEESTKKSVWSETSTIYTNKNNELQHEIRYEPIKLKENTRYILRVELDSGCPTKLGYWLKHIY